MAMSCHHISFSIVFSIIFWIINVQYVANAWKSSPIFINNRQSFPLRSKFLLFSTPVPVTVPTPALPTTEPVKPSEPVKVTWQVRNTPLTTTSSSSTTPSTFSTPVNKPATTTTYTQPGAYGKPPNNLRDQPPINRYIKADRVRLIVPGNNTDDEDVMLGIFTLQQALLEAESRDLDLVMINDKGDPPVCKVIDYGKYRYFMEKKKKENLKKQAKVDIKEVKMSYKIDQHDFEVRLRSVQKFIEDGDRVKVVVQFKGRELQHKHLGKDLLMKLYKPVEEICIMEGAPKEEGRSYAMLLGPKKL